MARSNRAKTAGGYSADDIESGADDHSDGRSELYELHQRLQAEFRLLNYAVTWRIFLPGKSTIMANCWSQWSKC